MRVLLYLHMELFLAKLFGAYFLIIGAVVLARRRSIIPAVSDLAKNRALLLVWAFIEILGGVALVVTYPTVDVSLTGLFSLVGYMMVIEGIIYLGAPTTFVRKMIARFNKPIWYTVGGALSIVAGIYFLKVGFGVISF